MRIRQLIWGALFVALALFLPMAFHAVGLGRIFLPMHIPVLMAGLLAGPSVGLTVGITSPILSAILTGMPPLMPPTAQVMLFELGVYGLAAGLLHHRLHLGILPSLILAILGGRLIYGVLGWLVLPLLGLPGIPLLYPLTVGLTTSLPGVLLQLVVVPSVVYAAERTGVFQGARGRA
ncbi:MAG: ECF transporter S component [Bacillota bacterium]